MHTRAPHLHSHQWTSSQSCTSSAHSPPNQHLFLERRPTQRGNLHSPTVTTRPTMSHATALLHSIDFFEVKCICTSQEHSVRCVASCCAFHSLTKIFNQVPPASADLFLTYPLYIEPLIVRVSWGSLTLFIIFVRNQDVDPSYAHSLLLSDPSYAATISCFSSLSSS